VPGTTPPRPAHPVQPPVPGVSPARAGQPAAAPRPSGKVVHDDRGNAVWEFIAQTSRICIEATSRLLKKLETPELKIEDTQDKELRVMPEPGKGAGYDPYNQATKPPPKFGRK
jgi:hypothetical protein